VEDYLGYLQSCEVLTQAIVEGSAAAAKVLVMVNPNSTTRIKKVAEAANLDVIEGVATDVTFLHLEKYADFKVALETLNSIKTDLSACFLLNSSVQRQGERVTAEEIRYMAKELEDALGGVYTVQSKEFQLPLVKIIKLQMEKSRRLLQLPENKVKLIITTGLEALGRSHDLVKLNAFTQEIAALGPDVIKEYINVSDYITRVANGTGVDPKGLVKTEEEVQQAQAAAAQQAQQAQMGSDMVKSGAAAQLAKGYVDNANKEGGVGMSMPPGMPGGSGSGPPGS
jgi:chemotaxis response regulator CheB